MNISCCGFTGKNNLGDDLMAHYLSGILSMNGKNRVELFSDCESKDIQNGLKDYTHLNSDIIVIGGGGIINPNFWVFKDGGLEKLKKANKPIIFLNVGITSDLLYNKSFCDELKSLNANWWVRSHQSVKILNKIDVSSNFLPDISFITPEIPKGIKNYRKLSVFLNSYVFNNLSSKNNIKKFTETIYNCHTIAEYLDWMTNFGWNITFYAAHTAKEIDDRMPSSFIFSLMDNKQNVSWESSPLNWRKLVYSIQESDLVLSMRFHSTALALSNKVPVVDITHHDKNKSLFQDMKLNFLSVDYNNLTQKNLINATQKAENIDSYIELINDYKAISKCEWLKFNEKFAEICSEIK